MKLKRYNAECGDLMVELDGDFDAIGSAKIRRALENIADSPLPQMVFLDLAKVDFIDSSGVGAIVFLYKRLKENDRNLVITGVNGQPRELLELLRIHKAIPVEVASGEMPIEETA